jgi:RNA polymerase sigma factor for flagellar operon FliA
VARFFGQRLQKSKRITTTNWAQPRLSEKQILYAADDAHVALRVYRHWRASSPAK